jgi:hypothetical protein
VAVLRAAGRPRHHRRPLAHRRGADPEALHNARAPQLSLEIIYSDGPIGSPYLFDIDDPAKFLLGPDGGDVPRNQQRVDVARLVGATPLTADELGRTWSDGAPLWFYILKEAEHGSGGGDRLGPVGGRIVAEVLIGLLRADPASYLSLQPDWAPPLPAAGPTFGLADLLDLAVHRDGPAHPA